MFLVLFFFTTNWENQFNIVLYNKIYTIKKKHVVEKKSQGGLFYNIKLLSQNI